MAVVLAVLLFAHEDLELQIAEVTRQLELEPRRATLYLKRGELHRFHEDWSAARADYDRAARLDPALAEVDLARGRMWLGVGSPEQAEAALDRFLAKGPDHAGGLLERARARARRGRHAAAAEDFTRALERIAEPKPDFFIERAQTQSAGGDVDAALRGLEEGVRKLGPIVTLDLAALDLEVGARRFDAALTRLGRLAAAAPRPEPWLVRRGEVLREAGRPREAADAFRAALAAIASLPPSRRSVKATRELESRARAGLKEIGE